MVEVKGYAVIVHDYDSDNVEIEGVYKNLCEAIKKISSTMNELYENAVENENKVIKVEYYFDEKYLVKKGIISGNDIKLYEIKLDKITIQ